MPSQTSHTSPHASFDEAATVILRILSDGQWHKSTIEIHEPLRPRVAESMFLKVKTHYEIEHRQVGGGSDSYFEWRRPKHPRRA